MGEDCGTWIPQQRFDFQSPNLSLFGAPLDVGKQNGISTAVNSSGVDMVTRNETMPAYATSALPNLQLGHSYEPYGWFYCLPCFRQGFMPAPNFTAEEKLPAGHVKSLREGIAPNGDSGFPQKQFLVIDQTGDQTTLIYSSRFGSPVECLASWDSKLRGSNDNLNWNEPSLIRDLSHVVGPTLADDKVDENQGTDIESEMHEDTEEINALLYSDSDGYSTEDDEVTSTGHSPSTMTTHDNQEPFGEATEEVASSAGKTKKRKLSDGPYDDDVQFLDTASSQNRKRLHNGDGDDAGSRCSFGNNSGGSGVIGSLSSNRKMRKEKIQDVLSILQSIIPGGKDKDPIELLDDAIRCLKSLKLKARALGLDAL